MGSPSGSRLPARRLPAGPRLRAGWSSWAAVERPEGPIPSGAVPPAVAAGLGAALLAAGIVLAGLAGGSATLVAVVLALAIVLYDAVLKGTRAGFLNMGVCRGLNFYLPM